MRIKNRLYAGEAGLQLSINSTDEAERAYMFNGTALPLLEISRLFEDVIPRGRKIALNFAVAGYTIDAEWLARLFPPSHFMCKLTPMHLTHTALANGIATEGDYTTMTPYEQAEADLKAAGFDVLVFVASPEEDLGRITCGNAILSGSLPECEFVEEDLMVIGNRQR
jgi:23S rRNA (adenine2503-C2)-methyltransferase